MAEKKNPGIVEYVDDDGNKTWASADSKAYQKHLDAKRKQADKPKLAAVVPAVVKAAEPKT